MQITVTVRYHLTPLRMAIIKKSTNSKLWRESGGKETLHPVDGSVHWYNHYGEQYGGFLIELPYV